MIEPWWSWHNKRNEASSVAVDGHTTVKLRGGSGSGHLVPALRVVVVVDVVLVCVERRTMPSQLQTSCK